MHMLTYLYWGEFIVPTWHEVRGCGSVLQGLKVSYWRALHQSTQQNPAVAVCSEEQAGLPHTSPWCSGCEYLCLSQHSWGTACWLNVWSWALGDHCNHAHSMSRCGCLAQHVLRITLWRISWSWHSTWIKKKCLESLSMPRTHIPRNCWPQLSFLLPNLAISISTVFLTPPSIPQCFLLQ